MDLLAFISAAKVPQPALCELPNYYSQITKNMA